MKIYNKKMQCFGVGRDVTLHMFQKYLKIGSDTADQAVQEQHLGGKG